MGRGLVASRDIRKGEVVLSVPEDEILRADSLEDLTEKLLAHTGWYKQTLPRDLSYLPVYWSDEMLAELPLFAREAVENRKKGFDGKSEEWIWARSICGSRNFGHNKQYTLVPEADLMNSSETCKNTSWKFNDGFKMETTEFVGKGDELFDSYGCKCALSSFLYYGFVAQKLKNYHIENNGAILTPRGSYIPPGWKPEKVPLGSGEARKLNKMVRQIVRRAKVRARRAGIVSSRR